MDDDEHVYSWAWHEKDNPDQDSRTGLEPIWWRVFRYGVSKAYPVTEPMSRDEARAKCAEIVKLTGGRSLT